MKFNRLTLLFAALGMLTLVSCASPHKQAQKHYAQGKSDYLAQNYNKSFQEIRSAALAGDPDAEYALGYMYYYGRGTPQDTEMAKAWMRRAAAQGQPQAVRALQLLGKENQLDKADAKLAQTQEQPTLSVQPVSTKRKAAPSKARVAADLGSDKADFSSTGSGYTIQLLGSHSQADILQFMRTNNLDDHAAYYKTTFRSKPWYVLVYGHYASRAAAKKAIGQLPAKVRQQKPWIKPLSSVKANLEHAK